MEGQVVATLITEGSRLVGSLIKSIGDRPVMMKAPPKDPTTQPVVPQHQNTTITGIDLPTSEETTTELKRRLAKELYKAELDLANGLLIAGKPCDCLSNKHSLEFEAACEELISQDPGNSVYREIIGWMNSNLHKCYPDIVLSGQYKSEYPYMALQLKEFRKRILGSSASSSVHNPVQKSVEPVKISVSQNDQEITLEEAQELAAEQARAEVKRRWTEKT